MKTDPPRLHRIPPFRGEGLDKACGIITDFLLTEDIQNTQKSFPFTESKNILPFPDLNIEGTSKNSVFTVIGCTADIRRSHTEIILKVARMLRFR